MQYSWYIDDDSHDNMANFEWILRLMIRYFCAARGSSAADRFQIQPADPSGNEPGSFKRFGFAKKLSSPSQPMFIVHLVVFSMKHSKVHRAAANPRVGVIGHGVDGFYGDVMYAVKVQC